MREDDDGLEGVLEGQTCAASLRHVWVRQFRILGMEECSQTQQLAVRSWGGGLDEPLRL